MVARSLFLALGGGDEIGASCYCLKLGAFTLMIDAGMRMHSDRAFPDFALLNELIGGVPALGAFLLTHAHLDHCGALTRMHFDAPRVPKYATPPTRDLVLAMLGDALQAARHRQSEDWAMVETSRVLLAEAIDSFHPLCFHAPVTLGLSGVRCTAIPAGHILGAASFLIEADGFRVLHTGDICLHPQRTIAGFDLKAIEGPVDVLVMESTYADDEEEQPATVEEQHFALVDAIQRVVSGGGRVLIPSFALGRAQEIVCLLQDVFEQGLVPPFPVVVDGLVKPICDVFNWHRPYLSGRLQVRAGHALYSEWVRPTPARGFPTAQSVASLPPTCIISSSGMLLDRTRSAAYASQMLPNPGDAILFSGYQDDESPGARLLGFPARGRSMRLNDQEVAVAAQVSQYRLRAHATAADLRTVVEWVRPRMLVLVHGNPRPRHDAKFTRFLMKIEAEGTQVHHAVNGVPIFF